MKAGSTDIHIYTYTHINKIQVDRAHATPKEIVELSSNINLCFDSSPFLDSTSIVIH